MSGVSKADCMPADVSRVRNRPTAMRKFKPDGRESFSTVMSNRDAQRGCDCITSIEILHLLSKISRVVLNTLRVFFISVLLWAVVNFEALCFTLLQFVRTAFTQRCDRGGRNSCIS